MSRSNVWPFREIELAFFTRPVAGLMTPGMPMPTRGGDAEAGFGVAHQAGDAFQRRRVAVRRVDPVAKRSLPSRRAR